jgi:hypothetical protein
MGGMAGSGEYGSRMQTLTTYPDEQAVMDSKLWPPTHQHGEELQPQLLNNMRPGLSGVSAPGDYRKVKAQGDSLLRRVAKSPERL